MCFPVNEEPSASLQLGSPAIPLQHKQHFQGSHGNKAEFADTSCEHSRTSWQERGREGLDDLIKVVVRKKLNLVSRPACIRRERAQPF